ncbi:MAG: succinate dehydrogenase cytochrome b subunit [Bacteroidales bacterium]|nr:succinate dehydrogenase cytochrome b subunit [Candidatus Hennigimonas equi]
MANIFKTSIGKKLIMSISGGFLIIFMLLHMTINSFSLLDTLFGRWGAPDGWFQLGCDFMALPVVNVMVPVLALGFIIHILYGILLTVSNFRSRGGFNRYEVDSRAKNDSFAAKNMIYLGIIVLGFICFHLTHFWQDMQLQEWTGGEAENPYFLLERTFGSAWVVILYIIWFIALYMHIGHGFWSAFQTLGWNNMTWLPRLKWIGRIVGFIICMGLVCVAICSYCHANGLFGLTSVTNL